MSHENDFSQDRKARYTASTDPQKLERERELSARLTVAECVAEEVIFDQFPLPERKPGQSDQQYLDSVEPPSPVKEATIRRDCSISRGEWEFIKGLKLFRLRFHLSGSDLWTCWTVPVINQARSFLLKNYRSQKDLQREKAERSQQKVAARQATDVRRDGKPYEKSPEQRAAIAERTRAAWARRKANGEKP